MNTCTSDHPAGRLLTDHPDRFARQGAVVAAWRTSRGRRLKRQARLRTARFRQEVIRPLNQYIQQMFALFGNGLYLKGSEVRGIRLAGPRLTAADVPAHLIPEFPFPLPAPLAALASPELEFSPFVDQNDPHRSQPNSEFSPLVDQNDPHHSSPELEFSQSVDQNSPHHPPLEPKPRQVRNPAFTQTRPYDAYKPRTKPPTIHARFPKEIAGSCHRRSRSPPPAPKHPASARSPMERGLPVLHPENRRNHLQYKTLATVCPPHLSIDVDATDRTNRPMGRVALLAHQQPDSCATLA